jgi:phosphotransferase system HPr (HPr) family protein
MKEEKVVVSHSIKKEHSLANLVQIACKYHSQVSIQCKEKTLNAKSILGVLSLNPQVGTELVILTDGSDECEAIHEIVDYLC